MRALVTGANGLIGANLVRELLRAGYLVRAFVRPTSDLTSLEGLDAELVRGDVLAPETLDAAARGCDVLFHTAAIFAYHGWTTQQLNSVAVQGTLHAIEAAHRQGLKRVVVTSSSDVLGSSIQPVVRDEWGELQEAGAPPYCWAKLAQERAAFVRAAELGMPLVAVCPTICVGPHDTKLSPSNAVITSYLADPFRMTFPGGCNIVSVRDVAAGHILAAERGEPGTRYVLGSENLEWSSLHRIISELCGIPGPSVLANHTGSYLVAAGNELLAWLARTTPSVTRAQAKMVGRYYWYRHDRAAGLGYAPKPARRALAEAVSWLAASPHVSNTLRGTLKLSPEVYDTRKSSALSEARQGTPR